VQVAAKEAEVTRLANEVDALGLQLGRTRGELAKQVWPTACLHDHGHPLLVCFCCLQDIASMSHVFTADWWISHAPDK
jgi:hypothetical protein